MSIACTLPAAQSRACFLNFDEMLVNGVSFSAPVSGVTSTPDHGGNFLIKVYNTSDPSSPVAMQTTL